MAVEKSLLSEELRKLKDDFARNGYAWKMKFALSSTSKRSWAEAQPCSVCFVRLRWWRPPTPVS